MKRQVKKFLSALPAFCLLLSLAACGGDSGSGGVPTDNGAPSAPGNGSNTPNVSDAPDNIPGTQGNSEQIPESTAPTEPDENSAKRTIIFGSYEQDNNPDNGKEPIEWIVLDESGDELFVVSKYGLDCQNIDYVFRYEVTWEEMTIYQWLHETFYADAFSAAEQGYVTDVTLLSKEEAERYMTPKELRAFPTEYAIAMNAPYGGSGGCFWSLRDNDSDATNDDVFYYVSETGGIRKTNIYELDKKRTVRPALYLKADFVADLAGAPTYVSPKDK